MVYLITCYKGLTDDYYYCFIIYLNGQASGMATKKCECVECFTTLRYVVLILSKAEYFWQIKVRITTTIGD